MRAEHLGFLKAAGCSPEHIKRMLKGQAPVNEVSVAEEILKRKREKKANLVDDAVHKVEEEADAVVKGEKHAPGKTGRRVWFLQRILGSKEPAKTASVRRYQHARRIQSGKVPKTSLQDLRELRHALVTQERRMQMESGKGPVVRRSSVWRKHTRKGGRSQDVRDSLVRQLTVHAPIGDPEGVKTVQFRTDAAKSKARSKTKKA